MTRPSRRTIRPLLPAVAVIGALGLAACGGETPPPPTSTSAGSEAGEASETSPEPLDKPEQQQVDAATAKAALPTVKDMPDDGWEPNVLRGGDDDGPPSYDPAVCADIEFESEEVLAFEKEHRKVKEEARYAKFNGQTNLITATYVESYDEPYPLSAFDAAGEHVTDCASYTRTQNGFPSERKATAIVAPQLGDRSFGLRMNGVDRLYVRSGHNVITVMTLTQKDEFDGELMTTYAQDILDKLKTSS